MARIEAHRLVAADPASVALLLSELPTPRDPERTWVVGSPRREGTTYAAAAQSSDVVEFRASGELTIDPVGDGGCELRLVVDIPAASAATVGRARRSADRFLAVIAYRARSRSLAA